MRKDIGRFKKVEILQREAGLKIEHQAVNAGIFKLSKKSALRACLKKGIRACSGSQNSAHPSIPQDERETKTAHTEVSKWERFDKAVQVSPV
jgi:hypothetical protein